MNTATSSNFRIGMHGIIGNSLAISSSSSYALVINNGVAISNSAFSHWNQGNEYILGYYGTYQTNYSSTNIVSYGNWEGESNKFIGVRFDISGNTHFGWVRLSVPNDYSSVTIHDYAYEDVAGTAITTPTTTVPVVNNITLSGCDTVTIFGNTYTTSQIVNDTIIGGAVSGADSITITNISVNNSITVSVDTTLAKWRKHCNRWRYNNYFRYLLRGITGCKWLR